MIKGHVVFTTPEELNGNRWDQIWLCMSSTGLREGDWFQRLVKYGGDQRS